MYPPGAYVTYEHEYILIFRKGGKREFPPDEVRKTRRESAYFWEERNVWVSDVWEFKGTSQKRKDKNDKTRTGAYPFELPYRLINMFSIKGDTVVNPFLGTGTSMIAAIASGRNCVGYEINQENKKRIEHSIQTADEFINSYIRERMNKHNFFMVKQTEDKKKYQANNHSFFVKTRQEVAVSFDLVRRIDLLDSGLFSSGFTANYERFHG